jgi:hypothetical protein
LVRLQEAGREAKSALLSAGLLAVLSLVLASVLALSPGKEADVVWPEEFQSVKGMQSIPREGP